ncbi:MAG: YfcE family phosphodiesterase [Methanobrevibacter sp.]|jgi:putative phosphoesterase|nr:YfcE family phosphodiesterase [Candidatus Methanovirga meridionalis]
MVLIGLISDTHVGDKVESLPANLSTYFKDVELILHAGDLTSLKVIEELEKIAPTKAVQGNMDRFYGVDLPVSHVETVEGVKIGVKHGEVNPKGDTQQLEYIARELEVDVLVSGHSHQPLIEQANDILLINPGSPTKPLLTDPTVMLMTVEDGEVDVEIIKIGPPTCSSLNFKKEKKNILDGG